MVRLLPCCALLLVAACSKPHPPEKERPPEPQAALAHAIQAPIDKARSVQETVDEAAAERDAEIERQQER